MARIAGGATADPLPAAFQRLFDAGFQRMVDSARETRELFDETREQLLILLRQMEPSGEIARSLAESPTRTEKVFGTGVSAVLADVYGDAAKGYRLAIEQLIESGQFGQALELLGRDGVREVAGDCSSMTHYARAMDCHYGGDAAGALEGLIAWVKVDADVPGGWQIHAAQVLASISDATGVDPGTADGARELAKRIEAR